MSVDNLIDPCVAQLIDANLDRSREGLRVVEDWCRFGIRNRQFVEKLKDWRQQLGKHHLQIYKEARSIKGDSGIGLNHSEQATRKSPENVVAANCARVQEALRVIEEFSRNSNSSLSDKASEIRYGLYDLEIKVLNETIGFKRREILKSCNVYLITASKEKEKLNSIIKDALNAGIRMIQYRCKEDSYLAKYNQARYLSDLCKSFGALFIVNDSLDLAIAVDADGVHLGQNDYPTEVARRIIGSQRLLGRSTHCLEEIKLANKEDIDYLGVGPVFHTDTKPGKNPLGLSYLREASKATSLPWYAIGGVSSSKIKAIRQSGAERIAVLGSVMNSNNPADYCRDLLEKM